MTEDKRWTARTRMALLSLIAGCMTLSGQQGSAQQIPPVSPDLTPKLRNLLRKEMLSIEDASKQILSHRIAGEHAKVAEVAPQIHDSFILQQAMTPEDKKDLMAAVPDDFMARDCAFHA